MGIYLGNLSVNEMQNRTGVIFHDDLVSFLNDNHQDSAKNVAKGKWHCFDIPFVLVAGDIETAQFIYDHLKNMASDFKEQLQISISA